MSVVDKIFQVARRPEREKLTLREYVGRVLQNPRLARSAHAYLLDALLHKGLDDKGLPRAFTEEIYGVDESIEELFGLLKAAAQGHDVRRRILLLVGPPGTAKSTAARVLKRVLEEYSRTDEGAVYALEGCAMHCDPLTLLPPEARGPLAEAGIRVEGVACPQCRYRLESGEWPSLEEAPVVRIFLSEADQVGIATFQPGDPNSQDLSELLAPINYVALQRLGDEHHPLARNLSGALFKANRGLMEFIEIFKATLEMLHPLITLAEERKIKVPGFALIDADEVLLAHTNFAEYERFMGERKNEALRDRTRVVHWRYNLRLPDEERIYRKMLTGLRAHLAPWTLTGAAHVALLTRLQPREGNAQYAPLVSLRLYATEWDGSAPRDRDSRLVGYGREHLDEMKRLFPKDGTFGLSPRVVVDAISALAAERPCVTPPALFRYLRERLKEEGSGVKAEEVRKAVDLARGEYEAFVQEEVTAVFLTSFGADAQAMFDRYLDHAEASTGGERVQDPVTGEWLPPDNRFLRSLEEAVGITETQALEFRREVVARVGAIARKTGGKVPWDVHPKIAEAIRKKLYADRAKLIRTTLSVRVPDEEQKALLEKVRSALLERGYCEHCAQELLDYAGRILDRGES